MKKIKISGQLYRYKTSDGDNIKIFISLTNPFARKYFSVFQQGIKQKECFSANEVFMYTWYEIITYYQHKKWLRKNADLITTTNNLTFTISQI